MRSFGSTTKMAVASCRWIRLGCRSSRQNKGKLYIRRPLRWASSSGAHVLPSCSLELTSDSRQPIIGSSLVCKLERTEGSANERKWKLFSFVGYIRCTHNAPILSAAHTRKRFFSGVHLANARAANEANLDSIARRIAD